MKMKRKVIVIIMGIIIVLSISVPSFAHKGRTDANGGHKDNKNASGLGSYHYHCGGHEAHLHTNGICPYSSKSTSTKSSSSNNKSSTNNKTSSSTKTSNNNKSSGNTNSTSNTKSSSNNENINSEKTSFSNNITNTENEITNKETKDYVNTQAFENKSVDLNETKQSEGAGTVVGATIATATIGGLGYWGYKKTKKK